MMNCCSFSTPGAPGFSIEGMSPRPDELQKPTVLVVEDECVVREVTCAVLARAGYHVLPCTGPEEALRIVDEHSASIDLLLSDVVMPGMNGVELAERLTRFLPGLITVFMSGYANRDLLKQPFLDKVTYIQKPFTIDGLLAGVSHAWQQHGFKAAAKLTRISA